MKKVLKKIARYLVVIILLVVLPGIVGWSETHYTRDGIITEVEGTKIIVCDITDNEWVFEGEGFAKGDLVTMTMFDNGTHSNIYDDEIDDVKIIK